MPWHMLTCDPFWPRSSRLFEAMRRFSAETIRRIRAVANDPRGDPATRTAAQRKLEELEQPRRQPPPPPPSLRRCAFPGCRMTSEHPMRDRWRRLPVSTWPVGGWPDGLYCAEHAIQVLREARDLAKKIKWRRRRDLADQQPNLFRDP
jgi:hypothetical protein